jgi:hypothetical protein
MSQMKLGFVVAKREGISFTLGLFMLYLHHVYALGTHVSPKGKLTFGRLLLDRERLCWTM